MSYYTYAGAYLTIPQKTTREEISYLACVNEVCKSYQNKTKSRFCPNCGSKIQETTKLVDETFDLYDWLLDNEFNEEALMRVELSSTEEDLYVPNIHFSESVCGIDVDPDEKLDITSEYIEQTIENFHKNFEEIITELKDQGYEFTIKFGVLHYYM